MSNLSREEINKAFQIVFYQLRKDEGLYYGWQSNIAVQFMDECHRNKIYSSKLHEISNRASKSFLNLLIK